MKKLLFIVLSIMVWTSGMTTGDAMAQADAPDINVSLALDQSTPYAPGDPIEIVMTLAITGNDDVITSKGFSDTKFYLYLIFIDPDGQVITSNKLTETNTLTPPPPRVFVENGHLIQGELVETLGGGWKVSFKFNARAYYPLPNKGGLYTVKALIPMRAYPQTCLRLIGSGTDSWVPINCDGIWYGSVESATVSYTQIADSDGDTYFYPVTLPGDSKTPDCDDRNPTAHPGAVEIQNNGIDDDCDYATPDVQAVEVETGTIMIQADKHTVGSGSRPGSTKEPLSNLPVRIYDKSSGSCAAGFGISWQNYMSIWLSCDPQDNGVGLTGEDGTLSLEVIPGDYLLIGEYDPDVISQNGNEIYIGRSVGNVGSDQIKKEYLQVIVKADGRLVPAKYTLKTGSELLVIEPEYIEWDGTQELYPFVFESIGDWSVTTAVTPPEGFVADTDSLSEEVNSELEAVQFTITDVGSDWKATCVEHTVTHKKNTQTIFSRVGLKITKKLAEEKGLDIQAILENQREAIQENSQYCHELEQENKQESDQETPPKGKKK
jgi:hypothetical protein